MIGIVIFLVGSALSGLSQSMKMLILFRAIQGIGAGSLFPVALAIIGDLFSPRERGKYQGLFGAVYGIAFIIGPLVGGFLTQNVSWHWIFYVNIPIGIVSLLVIQRLLPTVRNDRATRGFDILGGAIFTVAITLLLLGLTNKGLTDSATHRLIPWTDSSVGGLIVASIGGLILFVLAEARAKEPIVPLHLFRIRTCSSSIVATFFASFAFVGAIIFLPRWFHFVHDFSPTSSGFALLPLMVGLISSSIASGFFVARGVQEAFSLAVAQTFWVGVAAAITAAVAAATIRETALRTSTRPSASPRRAPAVAAEANTGASRAD